MTEETFWLFANYGAYERHLSSLMLSLAMLGMGAMLTLQDFARVFLVAKSFSVGMIVHMGLVPVLAALFLLLLAAIPDGLGGLSSSGKIGIGVGIALVAAMPGGSASNIFTYLGRGNVALSVAMTGVATLICLVSTPIIVGLLVEDQIPGGFEMDALRIVRDIASFLLLPLGLGMLIGAWRESIRERFSRLMIRGSLVMLGIIIVGSLGAGRLNLAAYGLLGPALVVLFCIAAQNMALLATKGFRLPPSDSLAIVIEVTVRNTLLGLLLITSMFPADLPAPPLGPDPQAVDAARNGCTFVVLFYGGFSFVASIAPIHWHRRRLAAVTPSPSGGK